MRLNIFLCVLLLALQSRIDLYARNLRSHQKGATLKINTVGADEGELHTRNFKILWVSDCDKLSSACYDFDQNFSQKESSISNEIRPTVIDHRHFAQEILKKEFEDCIPDEDIPWLKAVVIKISPQDDTLSVEKVLDQVVEWMDEDRVFHPMQLLSMMEEKGDTPRPARNVSVHEPQYTCKPSDYVDLFVYAPKEDFVLLEQNVCQQQEDDCHVDLPLIYTLEAGNAGRNGAKHVQRILDTAKLQKILQPLRRPYNFCMDKTDLNNRIKKSQVLWLKESGPIRKYTPYPAFISECLEQAYRNGLYSFSQHWECGAAFKYGSSNMVDIDGQNVDSIQHGSTLKVSLLQPCFELFPHRARVKRFPPALCPEIPQHLQEEIISGNCILFLGSGFVKPGGSPTWGGLLREIAHKGTQLLQTLLHQSSYASFTKCLDYFGEGNEVENSNKCQKELDIDDQIQIFCAKQAKKLIKSKISGMQASEPDFKIRTSKKETARRLLQKELEDVNQEVKDLTSGKPNNDDYEQAAQLLEDWLTADLLNLLVCKRLLRLQYFHLEKDKERYALMLQRLEWLRNVPFSAVLTTNYDLLSLVCAMATDDQSHRKKVFTPLSKGELSPPYWDILRSRPDAVHHGLFEESKPFLQIHGSVNEPNTVVLSTEGYRKLINSNPGYSTFLKSLMATKTILYIGCSFADDYLNELRSSVMHMVDYDSQANPLGYAIVNDKSRSEVEYFLKHEGVQFLAYNTTDYGWGGCDQIIAEIGRLTNPAFKLEKPLQNTCVLVSTNEGPAMAEKLRSKVNGYKQGQFSQNDDTQEILKLLRRVSRFHSTHYADHPLEVLETSIEKLFSKMPTILRSDSKHLILVYLVTHAPETKGAAESAKEEVMNFLKDTKLLMNQIGIFKSLHVILYDPLDLLDDALWQYVPPMKSFQALGEDVQKDIAASFESCKPSGASVAAGTPNISIVQCARSSEVVVAMLNYVSRSTKVKSQKSQKAAFMSNAADKEELPSLQATTVHPILSKYINILESKAKSYVQKVADDVHSYIQLIDSKE